MAEERTLGLARAHELEDEEPSKEALQLRMEEARDSISQTVTEIKDNVTQQYENVKDTLDWREHFKKQPVAWSVGAVGMGFFLGYGIAAVIKDSGRSGAYVDSAERPYASEHIGEPLAAAISPQPVETNGKDKGRGLVSRFKETRAFDRLEQEVSTLGDRLVDELSTTAQEVVLPALLAKIKQWIGADLSAPERGKLAGASMRPEGSSYKPSLERNLS